jgi:ribosomal RNA assembly protein
MEVIKIPLERVKVLIGENGETKNEIEKRCNIKLRLREEGEIEIDGETTDVYFAKDVIKAIGRGFDPSDALKLCDENYVFFLFNLKEYLPTEKAITRIKGRIIGTKGKMKKEIENATESKISVFGNTIGIISKIDTIEYAKEAILKIIDGAEHSSVYTYLAKVRREILGDRLCDRFASV